MSAAASEEEAVQQRQEEREAQAKETEGESIMLTHQELIVRAHLSCSHISKLRIMLSIAWRKRRRPGMCCQVATKPCLDLPC